MTPELDRSATWRTLSAEERAKFRVAGRADARACIEDVRGLEFRVSPWHHPEYRIGALVTLLTAAKIDAERLDATRAPLKAAPDETGDLGTPA